MNFLRRIKAYSPGPAVYLFGAVFLLRIYALGRLSSSPFLLPARGDMYFYNDWALRILSGALTDNLAFYGLPLYAYGLAVLYKVFGYSPFIPAFLQACLEGGTAVLIYRITLRALLGRFAVIATNSQPSRPIQVAGIMAGVAWGIFVPAQAYAIILMPTAWLIFVFWFVVWRIVQTDLPLSRREYLLLGLLVGVTAMGIATILFLTPLLLATAARKKSSSSKWHSLVTAAALLIAGVVAGTSPCWIHNYFIARDPVFLSAHSGINFWIGNNPDANGYPRFPPGLHAGQAAMLQDSITTAEAAAGRPLKRADVSHYWSAKARDYIRTHPIEWIRLLGLKLLNFWSAFRYDDLSIVTSLREHAVILPGISFGVVAAFALVGMFFAAWLSKSARWVVVAILLHMAALIPVFVTERYRLPIVPGLLVCAVFGLVLFWESVTQAHYRRVVVFLALLSGATVLVSWPQKNPSLWALDPYNSGLQALELGREALGRDKGNLAHENFAAADQKLATAFAYVPDNAELNFALGELRQVEGQTGEAKSFYAATLKIDARHERAFNNLGVLALEEKRYPLAESFFRHSLTVDPRNAKTHFLMAKAYLGQGHTDSAAQEVDMAIGLSPSQREFQQLRDAIRAGSRL